MPGFTAPKLLWVARNEPEVFEATKTVLLPKDYVRFCMTGEKASDMSDAAGTLWLVVGAEQRRAVHLPGNADPAHRAPDGGGDRGDGGGGRDPPRLRALFGPQRVRTLDGECGKPLGSDRAVLVERDRLDPRSADIDA